MRHLRLFLWGVLLTLLLWMAALGPLVFLEEGRRVPPGTVNRFYGLAHHCLLRASPRAFAKLWRYECCWARFARTGRVREIADPFGIILPW